MARRRGHPAYGGPRRTTLARALPHPRIAGLLLVAALAGAPVAAAKADADKPKDKDVLSSGTFSGLKLREIGPALTSGRVIDIAVDPANHAVRYVAAASG